MGGDGIGEERGFGREKYMKFETEEPSVRNTPFFSMSIPNDNS
jgi:hypothetical protein